MNYMEFLKGLNKNTSLIIFKKIMVYNKPQVVVYFKSNKQGAKWHHRKNI